MRVTELDCASAELRIDIRRDERVRFVGTAAQLIAEGLIPEGFVWPQAAAGRRWEASGFAYCLRRTRPEGHKGPMRSWLALDHWCLRVEVIGRDPSWTARRALERKVEALRVECHEHTPTGRRERDARFKRYLRAQRDPAYQAFKTLVPGLVPPKRGRKSCGTTQHNAQGVTP